MGVASTFLNQWLALNVAKYRKRAEVPYPNAYATATETKDNKAKYLFNCAQRSHATYLEHWPTMLVGLFAGGLKCMLPVLPMCLCILCGRESQGEVVC